MATGAFNAYISGVMDGTIIVGVGSRKVKRPSPRLDELYKELRLPVEFDTERVLNAEELKIFRAALELRDHAKGIDTLQSSIELYEAWQTPLQKELEAHQTLLRRYYLARFSMDNLNLYFALMGFLEDLLGVEPQLEDYLQAVSELHSHRGLNAEIKAGDKAKYEQLMAMLTSLELHCTLGYC